MTAAMDLYSAHPFEQLNPILVFLSSVDVQCALVVFDEIVVPYFMRFHAANVSIPRGFETDINRPFVIIYRLFIFTIAAKFTTHSDRRAHFMHYKIKYKLTPESLYNIP